MMPRATDGRETNLSLSLSIYFYFKKYIHPVYLVNKPGLYLLEFHMYVAAGSIAHHFPWGERYPNKWLAFGCKLALDWQSV